MAKKTKSIPIRQFRVVRPKPPCGEKDQRWMESAGLSTDKLYLVLGEVSAIKHYIILDYALGRILPGMYHLDRFETVPDDEL